MDFGLLVGTRGAAGTPEGLRAIAQRAEDADLAWLGFYDHTFIVDAVESRYPYSETGRWPAADTDVCLEQLMTIAHVAAFTRRIRLLTSVMEPLRCARGLATNLLPTADVLSGGRLAMGIDVFWLDVEKAAVLRTPETYAAAYIKVHECAADAGRAPAAFGWALFVPWYRLGGRRERPFTGSAAEIAADARAWRDAGVRHLLVGFESGDLAESLARIDAFASEVAPLAA